MSGEATANGRRRIVIAAASNDDAVLRRDLLASPDVDAEAVRVQRGYRSATQAYNDALDAEAGRADAVVFAHQDVYLPAGWLAGLDRALAAVEAQGRPWAVMGVHGVPASGASARVGRVWSSGLGRLVGDAPSEPCDVVAVDEVLIVVNASSGVRFDDGLPGYHLYGADVVTTALASGYRAVVADLPLVHNSRPVTTLDLSYGRAYAFMQAKWRSRLPIETCVVPVTRSGWPLLRYRLRRWRSWGRRRPAGNTAVDDPSKLARELGLE